MKRFTLPVLGLLLAAGLSLAAPGSDPAKTFVGNIGDSMCGAKHMMPGESDKDCTLGCVKEGAKYILIDPSGKIYQLSTPLHKSANVFGPAFPVTLTTRNRGDTERALGQAMPVSSLSILSPSATQPDLTGPAWGRSMANTFSSPLP